MTLIFALLAATALVWGLTATTEKIRLGLSMAQAVLYAPLKLAYRISDSRIEIARDAAAPVVYVVSHRSRLDPALMLCLLPTETLHILDAFSAKSPWLEPWRDLARTIAFNAEHVFVSRRLVRVLKGRGRLAVYIPEAVEPDMRSFRLYRAVIRIAMQADARIMPIFIGGAQALPFPVEGRAPAPRRWFPRLSISLLEPMTAAELAARNGAPATSNANALFDRMAETRLAATDPCLSLFQAVRDAAERFGPGRMAIEDATGKRLSYRTLLAGARSFGARLAGTTQDGGTVGVLLPNSVEAVQCLLGLASAGRVAALVDGASGPAHVAAAVHLAAIRTVIASRRFVEKAGLVEAAQAAQAAGAELIWLEDLQAGIGGLDRAAAAFAWRYPLRRQAAEQPAVILFSAGMEKEPTAVALSHRNLVTNAMQVEARLAITPDEAALNMLPMSAPCGLVAGTVLPLISGMRLALWDEAPSPETAGRLNPALILATENGLAQYARGHAEGGSSSPRPVVAGTQAVKPETREIWHARFDTPIIEGYGLAEGAGMVALNSAIHGREGSMGRLLPGMRMRIEPVEGIAEGGRLHLCGPNMMLGYVRVERPGEFQPLADDWHDTGVVVKVDREGFITPAGAA